jgi:site-specific DNA-methyltransferase (adenine-specific)
LFSFVGDVVLDPFAGSGTTLLACYQLQRIGIGVEISRTYCELAAQRLRTAMKQKSLFESQRDQRGKADRQTVLP